MAILEKLLPFFAEQFDPSEEIEKHLSRRLERRELDLLREMAPMVMHFCSTINKDHHEGRIIHGDESKNFADHHPQAYATLVSFLPNLAKPLLNVNDYVMKSQIEGSGAVIVGVELGDILAEAVRQLVHKIFENHGLIDEEMDPLLLKKKMTNKSASQELEEEFGIGMLNTNVGVENEGESSAKFSKKYYEEITRKAKNLSEFIIMRKVKCPSFLSPVLIPKLSQIIVRKDAIGELGIFSCLIGGRNGQCLKNYSYGHLVRSKGVKTDQGGVFLGHATLDAPVLV